jgi:hypothetical protein
VKLFASFYAFVSSYWPRSTAPTVPGEKDEDVLCVFCIIEFIITIMDEHHFLPSRCTGGKKIDIVGNSKRNSLCSNIKKFSKSEGVMNVTYKTSYVEKLCCKKCGIVFSAKRTGCVVCCEMAGSKCKHSISKKTAVVRMYAGIVARYSHQIVCLNSILQTKRSVQV